VPASSVDDIFQDTVLVAWRRLPDYDRTRPFGAWMRGIARNLVLDYRSKMGRERPTDDAILDGIVRRAEAEDRGDREEFRAKLVRLEDCVARLPTSIEQSFTCPIALMRRSLGSPPKWAQM
jgi:RNA polymerase sigma-70 factor (ECF subfamily)